MSYIEMAENVIKTYENTLLKYVRLNWSNEDINRLEWAINRIKGVHDEDVQ